MAECGKCSQVNSPDSQFCTGCGHALWEKCPKCEASSLIGQKFCNACGTDLHDALESRIESTKAALERATSLGHEGKYQLAIRQLELISNLTDFRFQQLSDEAKTLRQNLQSRQDYWAQELPVIESEAVLVSKQHDYKKLIAITKDAPEPLLSNELKELISQAKKNLERNRESKSIAQQALSSKDWPLAAKSLSQILEITPGHSKYTALLSKVVSKLQRKAGDYESERKYADALAMLDNIPTECESKEISSQRERLEEVVQLRRLIAKAPFASPIVGDCLKRVQKLTGNDEKLRKLLERHTKVQSAKRLSALNLYAEWMKSEPGYLGRPISPVTLSASIPGNRNQTLLRSGSQFWTALGLAMSATIPAANSNNFMNSIKHKGIKGLLGRKRGGPSNFVWGIDIGDSSIKALCLKSNNGKYHIENALLIPIESKQEGISEVRRAEKTAIYRALEKLAQEPTVRTGTVVSNVRSSELLSRYILLPVDKPKMHLSFIEQEMQANIPIASDLLYSSHHIFAPEPGSAKSSQQAVLSAVRRAEVDTRVSMFKQLDLPLDSLLGEPFALLHALANSSIPPVENTSDTKHATVMLDVGQLRTNIIVLDQSGCWFRAIDWGLSDLTQGLAREHKITFADAEKVRTSPGQASGLHKSLVNMRENCVVPRRELERSLNAARDTLGAFDPTSCFLVGGGAYQPLLSSWINGEEI